MLNITTTIAEAVGTKLAANLGEMILTRARE
jgi:hypothetical protein